MTFEIQSFLPPWIAQIDAAVSQAGGRLIIVGGFVRDCVLKYRPIDLDIEVYQIASLDGLREILSEFGDVNQEGAFFGVLSLKVNETISEGHYIDRAEFALPRLESSTGPGHKDFEIAHKPNLSFTQAARRRDFTVNAMGYDLRTKQLLDPYHGIRDAERRELHAVSDAFMEDPLRVFRAMQFAGRYGLSIGDDVIHYANKMDISGLTEDRMYRELGKLLIGSARPSFGLQWAQALGIGRALPELGELAQNAPEWEIIMEETDHLVLTRPSSDHQNTAAYSHMLRAIIKAIPKAKQLRFLQRFVPNKKVISALIPSANFRRVALILAESIYDIGAEGITFEKDRFIEWQSTPEVKQFIGNPGLMSVRWGDKDIVELSLAAGIRLFALAHSERENLYSIGSELPIPRAFIWHSNSVGKPELYYAYMPIGGNTAVGGTFEYRKDSVIPILESGQPDITFPFHDLPARRSQTHLALALFRWKEMRSYLKSVNTEGAKEAPTHRLPERSNAYLIYFTHSPERPPGSVNVILGSTDGVLGKGILQDGILQAPPASDATQALKIAVNLEKDDDTGFFVYRLTTKAARLRLPNGNMIPFVTEAGIPFQFASLQDLSAHIRHHSVAEDVYSTASLTKYGNAQHRQLSKVVLPHGVKAVKTATRERLESAASAASAAKRVGHMCLALQNLHV